MNTAVERAIACMWERYSEPLSLTDIARSAILSRFHFARVFKSTTGVSPGQFLSAVRIYQAKRMLLATSASVADVSCAVGYSSLGSFTSRFTDSVGLSPSRLRRAGGAGQMLPYRACAVPEGDIGGTLSLPPGFGRALVYLGVFDTAIVQRRPRAGGFFLVDSSRPVTCQLAGVPEGTWFVHALAAAEGTGAPTWDHRGSLVSTAGPVVVSPGARTHVTLALRPRQRTDAPVLLALPAPRARRDQARARALGPAARPRHDRPFLVDGLPPRS
jgi:AraC family transcriptional regulator